MVCNNHPMSTKEKAELAAALLLIGSGFSSFIFPGWSTWILFDLAGLICLLSAGLLLFQSLKSKRAITFIAFCLMILLGLTLCFHRIEGKRFVIGIMMFYVSFNCVLFFVQFTLDCREHNSYAWTVGLQGLIYLAVFILSLVFRHWGRIAVQYIFGCYLIAMGLQVLLEIVYFQMPRGTRAWVFRNWSLLPIQSLIILPSLAKKFAIRRRMNALDLKDCQKPAQTQPLQVCFEIAEEKREIRQMNLCYRGVVYAYGNFDRKSDWMFSAAGPGVLMTAPEQAYLDWICEEKRQTAVIFSINLDMEQEKRLHDKIRKLYDQSWRWYCRIERELPKSPEEARKYSKMTACMLSWKTGAKFRRFYHGRWKTIWTSGNSGALFASDILYDTDPRIVPVRGLNTPLEFFDLFVSALDSPLSPVAGCRIRQAGSLRPKQ